MKKYDQVLAAYNPVLAERVMTYLKENNVNEGKLESWVVFYEVIGNHNTASVSLMFSCTLDPITYPSIKVTTDYGYSFIHVHDNQEGHSVDTIAGITTTTTYSIAAAKILELYSPIIEAGKGKYSLQINSDLSDTLEDGVAIEYKFAIPADQRQLDIEDAQRRIIESYPGRRLVIVNLK